LSFYSAILSYETFGVHARLPNCWRGTWSEKGWEPLFYTNFNNCFFQLINCPAQFLISTYKALVPQWNRTALLKARLLFAKACSNEISQYRKYLTVYMQNARSTVLPGWRTIHIIAITGVTVWNSGLKAATVAETISLSLPIIKSWCCCTSLLKFRPIGLIACL